MPIYDEYQIVMINEPQRKVIMRALWPATVSRRARAERYEYMQLIRLFSTIKPSRRKDFTKSARLLNEPLTMGKPPGRFGWHQVLSAALST